MPFDLTKYPEDWKAFSYWVKHQRAGQRCECTGECGMHTPNPNPRRCVEVHRKPARWFKGTVRLVTAHLCTCDPPCRTDKHVKAMCQRCHLRVDRWAHARKAAVTKADPNRKARLRIRPPGEPPWPPSEDARQRPQDAPGRPRELKPVPRWHPKDPFALPRSPERGETIKEGGTETTTTCQPRWFL